jgi:hypothetical protein
VIAAWRAVTAAVLAASKVVLAESLASAVAVVSSSTALYAVLALVIEAAKVCPMVRLAVL